MHSELEVLDAGIRWLLYEWRGRHEHKVRVMSTVRFGLLSPLQLTQIRHSTQTADYEAIFRDESVDRMFQQGLAYSILRDSYKDKAADRDIWVHKAGLLVPKNRNSLASPQDSLLNAVRNRLIFNFQLCFVHN